MERTTQTGRSNRWIVVVATLAAMSSALVGSPAGAAPATAPAPITFTTTTGSTVAVSGTYIPLVGRFTSLQLDDIIWYALDGNRTGGPQRTDQRWSPCSGCAGGPFTKTQLQPQVRGDFDPMVGDFAGDEHDDIFWWSPGGGADYLWTNDGAGGFTSARLDMADGYGAGTVLHDRNAGKDDILWMPYDLGPEHSAFWIFPDDGSGQARTRWRLKAPSGRQIVGDYDGDGREDIFFYAGDTGCDYQCPPPVSDTKSTLWRHGGSTTSFAASRFTITQPYAPVAGRFGGTSAPDDLLLLGGYTPYRGSFIDGPDYLWFGRSGPTAGTFTQGSVSLPYLGGVVVHADSGDRLLAYRYGYPPEFWRRSDGVSVRQSFPDLGGDAGWALPGRFTVADHQDLFFYNAGSLPDALVHPDS